MRKPTSCLASAAARISASPSTSCRAWWWPAAGGRSGGSCPRPPGSGPRSGRRCGGRRRSLSGSGGRRLQHRFFWCHALIRWARLQGREALLQRQPQWMAVRNCYENMKILDEERLLTATHCGKPGQMSKPLSGVHGDVAPSDGSLKSIFM